MTRRASKYSGRVAVVFRFIRSRESYEQQAVLAETVGFGKAERERLHDADEAPWRGHAEPSGGKNRMSNWPLKS